MRALRRLLLAGVLVTVLAVAGGGNAGAVGPYAPTADTYTDRNYQDDNYGSEQNLNLSASNPGTCVATTYLWFKFAIPSTGTTINTASLALTFGSGSGTADLELLSSADTSWSETGLTWSNQPALDSPALATATGATSGSTATFSSAALADYLNARQGQTVSLVVRANCSGSVSTSVALPLRARENPSGSGASLALFGPNAVTLRSVTAGSVSSGALPSLASGITAAAVMALIFLGASTMAWRRIW